MFSYHHSLIVEIIYTVSLSTNLFSPSCQYTAGYDTPQTQPIEVNSSKQKKWDDEFSTYKWEPCEQLVQFVIA